MVAKPTIDMIVVVRPDDWAATRDALAGLGYRHEGDLGIARSRGVRARGPRPRRQTARAPPICLPRGKRGAAAADRFPRPVADRLRTTGQAQQAQVAARRAMRQRPSGLHARQSRSGTAHHRASARLARRRLALPGDAASVLLIMVSVRPPRNDLASPTSYLCTVTDSCCPCLLVKETICASPTQYPCTSPYRVARHRPARAGFSTRGHAPTSGADDRGGHDGHVNPHIRVAGSRR